MRPDSCLLHFSELVVEELLSSEKHSESAWDDILEFWAVVEEHFEEEPYAVSDCAGLDHLASDVHLVHGFEDCEDVLVIPVEDAWEAELEEVLVIVICEIDEVLHLILEMDSIVIHAWAKTLALEPFKNSLFHI